MIIEMEMENSGEDSLQKCRERGGGEGNERRGLSRSDKGKNSKTAEKKGQNIQNKGRKGKGKDSGCIQSRRDSEDGQYKGSSVPVKQSNQNRTQRIVFSPGEKVVGTVITVRLTSADKARRAQQKGLGKLTTVV